MPGPQSKYSPARRDRALAAARQGLPRRLIAQLAGVSERTIYQWLDDIAEFAALFARAEAEAEQEAAELVRVGGREDWRAAAWWLERRYPDRWGRQTRQPIPSREQIEQIAAEIAAESGQDAAALVEAVEAFLARASRAPARDG